MNYNRRRKFWLKREDEVTHTVEGNTGVVDPIDPIPPQKEDDLDGLKLALKKERELRKSRETELKTTQDKFKGISPDEYAKTVAELEAAKQTAAKQAETELKYKAEADRLTTEFASKSKAQIAKIEDLERRHLIKEAFLNAGGNHVSAPDGTSYYQLFEALQSGKFVIKDGVLSTTEKDSEGKKLTPTEYIKTLHTHAILGNCFTVPTPPGGTGGRHEGGTGKTEPKSASQMTAEERRSAYTKAQY